ncbi:MAG: sialidase family protein [Legionellaceae bacterium]|nr:sialidase family protein [Legionellaceae bacterium]
MKKVLLALGFILVSKLSFSSLADEINIKAYDNNLTSVACDSNAKHCLAVGFILDNESLSHVIYETIDSGSTWIKSKTLTHEKIDPSINNQFSNYYKILYEKPMIIRCDMEGVNCIVAGVKYGTSNDSAFVYTTSDSGTNWIGPIDLPSHKDGVGMISGLECSETGEQCVLLEQKFASNSLYIYRTQDSGQTWSNATNIDEESSHRYNDTYDLSCSSSGLLCTAVGVTRNSLKGDIASAYRTEDGGLTWSGPYFVNDENSGLVEQTVDDVLTGVHCDDTGLTCIAMRYREIRLTKGKYYPIQSLLDVYTTRDGGINWEKTGSIDNSNGSIYETFLALKCDSTLQKCLIFNTPLSDEDNGVETPLAYITSDGGYTWTTKMIKSGQQSYVVTDISCDLNLALCQAVGMTKL